MRQLYLRQPLNFGKHSSQTPLRVWSGAPGCIDAQLQASVVAKWEEEVDVQGKNQRIIDIFSKSENDTFKWELMKSSIIGMTGADAHDQYYQSFIDFVGRYRGEPTYINWLIKSTDYYFHPAELEILTTTQAFKHSELIVKRFDLNGQNGIFEFGIFPSTEVYQPLLGNDTLNLNQTKFDGNDFDDYDGDDDDDPLDDIDPDNPFGVSPEEAETIYWNTH